MKLRSRLAKEIKAFFEPVREDALRLSSWLNASFQPVNWAAFRKGTDSDKPFFDYAKHVLTLVAWWGAIFLIWRTYPDNALIPTIPLIIFGVVLTLRLTATTQLALTEIGTQLRGSPTWLGKSLGFISRWAFGFTIMGVGYMIIQTSLSGSSAPH